MSLVCHCFNQIQDPLFIVLDQKTTTTAYTNYYGGGYGGYHRYRGGWGYGYASTTYSENDYVEGTLPKSVAALMKEFPIQPME